MALTILGSTAFAIYWTVHADAMGDAFTTAGFFVAVVGLVVAVLLNRHSTRCTRWTKVERAENGSKAVEPIRLHAL